MANINIGGRLHSTATGNTVAGANEILDDNKGKKQSVINQEVDAALAGKQATIDDLSAIRSGAAAGATAYQKPASGVPASDLASGVIPDVSGFYTKPASGIPASDIASGVIPTVPTISTDISADAASDVKTSSPKSVKTYVDAGIAAVESDLADLADEVEAIDIGAYVTAWDGESSPVVANIPAGVVVTYGGTDYTGTLAASASTIQKIYLVATGTTDNYDRYITVGDSTYSWVNLGTTEITLADYATKTKVSQLEAKLNTSVVVDNEIPVASYAAYDQNSVVYDSQQVLPVGAMIKKVKCASTGTTAPKSTKFVVLDENNAQVSRNEIGTIGTTETEFDITALGIVIREGYKYCIECTAYKWVSGVNGRYSYFSGGNQIAYNDYYFGFAFVAETAGGDRLDMMEDAIASLEDTTAKNETAVELLDPQFVGEKPISPSVAESGKFVDASNNTVYSNSSFDISESIELAKGQTIKLTARGYLTAVGMINLYSSGAYAAKVVSVDSTDREYIYTADDTCIVRVCYNKNYAHSVSIITATATLLRIDKIEEELASVEKGIFDYPYMFTNVACVGDSLTKGSAGTNWEGDHGVLATNYPFYFGKMTDAQVANLGLPGRTTKEWWDEYNQQINFAPYDCVIIYLGTNGGLTDTASTDINTSDYSQCADTNTGCYGKIIGKIKAESPKCSIFVVAGPDEYINRSAMDKVVRDIAELCDVALLDLEDCILSDDGSAQSIERNLYRPIDGIHYNRLGYFTFASVIFDTMKVVISENLIDYNQTQDVAS